MSLEPLPDSGLPSSSWHMQGQGSHLGQSKAAGKAGMKLQAPQAMEGAAAPSCCHVSSGCYKVAFAGL